MLSGIELYRDLLAFDLCARICLNADIRGLFKNRYNLLIINELDPLSAGRHLAKNNSCNSSRI